MRMMPASIIGAVVLCGVFFYGTSVFYKILVSEAEGIETGEGAALSFGVSLVMLAASATALALIGIFSVPSLILCYGAAAGTAHVLASRFRKISLFKRAEKTAEKRHFSDAPLILILLAAGSLFFLFPSNYMWTGRDYGMYIVNAVHTAETGGARYETDSFLNENYEEIKEFVEIGYPALFSSYEDLISERPGDINAQFLPLYWCLLSVGYAVGGFSVLIRMTAVVTLLSISVFYYFVKRFFSKKAAVLSAALLAFCPAELWGARITQSEQLMQLIVLLMCFLFAVGWRQRRSVYLQLAAGIAGIGCFCRMDHYIMGIGLLCCCIYAALFCTALKKSMFRVTVHYMIWVLLSFSYGFAFHYHYYIEHWENGALQYLIMANALLFLFYTFCYFIGDHVAARFKERNNFLFFLCKKRKVVTGAAALLFLVYGFFYLKPYALLNGEKTAGVLAQYAWYICPVTLAFALYGFYKKCLVESRREFDSLEAVLLFLISGLGSLLLYSAKPSISMDHFWMSRRFLPINFPLLICFGMYGVSSLAQQKKRIAKAAAIVTAVFIFLYTGWRDKEIWNMRSYAGMTAAYDRISEAIPEDAFVLTANEGAAAALRYIYHKNVYMLKRDFDAESVSRYLASHDNVYLFGGLRESAVPWGIDAEVIITQTIATTAPERTYGSFPERTAEESRNGDVFRLRAAEADTVELGPYFIGEGDSERTPDGAWVLNGIGTSFYGPYFKAEPGKYEAEISFLRESEPDGAVGMLEIVVDGEVNERMEIRQGKQKLCFTLEETGSLLEFRFLKEAEGRAVCESILLKRISA